MTRRTVHTALAATLACCLPIVAQTNSAQSQSQPAKGKTSTAAHPITHRTTASHTLAGVPPLPKGVPPVKAPLKVQYVMRYQDEVVGQGELAKPGQLYKVNYTGWLASDGTKFDSSYDRGQPIEFPQGTKRVIIGWDQGFEGMHVGGKRRMFIPYQLAYGEAGRGPIPPKSDLIFDVELLGQRDPYIPAVEPQPATSQQQPSATPQKPQ